MLVNLICVEWSVVAIDRMNVHVRPKFLLPERAKTGIKVATGSTRFMLRLVSAVIEKVVQGLRCDANRRDGLREKLPGRVLVALDQSRSLFFPSNSCFDRFFETLEYAIVLTSREFIEPVCCCGLHPPPERVLFRIPAELIDLEYFRTGWKPHPGLSLELRASTPNPVFFSRIKRTLHAGQTATRPWHKFQFFAVEHVLEAPEYVPGVLTRVPPENREVQIRVLVLREVDPERLP